MKKSIIIAGFVAVTAFTALLSTSPARQQVDLAENTQNVLQLHKTAVYDQFIEKNIAHCETKGKIKSRKGENINQYAYLMRMRADFFKTQKNELISEMERLDIGTKSHQMNRFLNEKFHSKILKKTSDS
ncbi:hypothetical protein DENIS_3358 [Desulfonema ishimotonii]|uniref:Uncharacterized protein n=1 Tax=Desulfonema ishimotonii TaxID=45657 RepID=A0A401FZL8_9BACT|nr:hypothetical protein [Desulfonema ishimotonii]GBC62386.1 hypothetical protein DENIS_3358 [Desulfonema ishimotonii]